MTRVLTLALSVLALAGCSPEEPATEEQAERPLLDTGRFEGRTVATVNGTPIPEDILLAYLRMRGQIGADAERRQAALRELIDLFLLAEEAQKSGLANRDSIQALLAVQKLTLVANQVISDFAQGNPVTEAEIAAEYETQVGRTGEREYRVHHILTKDRASAEQLIARLEQGESFEALEQAHAEKFGVSAAGELGWVNLTQVPPPFGEALKTLEPGTYTLAPVQSEYGWHVILLDEFRTLEPPPIEEVSDGIRNTLGRQRIEEYLSDLRSEAAIELPSE